MNIYRNFFPNMKWLLILIITFILALFPACGAVASGLTHTVAARVFVSYANEISNWSESYYYGKHEDDGDGVILTGYVNGKKIEFSAHSYYYGLASMSLTGPFQDLKPGRSNELTDVGQVYFSFLRTIDDLGIVHTPVNGVSTGLWGPYSIYETISNGRISPNYSTTDWKEIEISKGQMTAFHADKATFLFDVDDKGDFSFWVICP